MGKVLLDMTMSLDGFVAGPNDEDGGLHDWAFPSSGGVVGSSGEVIEELVGKTGAVLMGRRTYALGDEVGGHAHSPFRVAHFVLSHDAPKKVTSGGLEFTFIADGVESALSEARAAAGGRDVIVMGGASTARQFLGAGLVDEVQIHLVPLLIGEGIRLFENIGVEKIELEKIRVLESPDVTHLKFRVVK